MEPPARASRLTASDLASLPDDERRHELEEGWLVSEPLPSLRHDRVRRTLERILEAYVAKHRFGEVFGEAGFILARNPDTVRGPDLSFVARDRLVGIDYGRFFDGAPDLAIEILSPSNRPYQVRAKVADYLAAGCRLVWVVDPEARSVTTYRALLFPRVLGAGDALDGVDLLPGLTIQVAAIFESPLDASAPTRLLEASRFLMRQGDVYDALRRLAQRLDDEGLDYAVIGGMAVVEHGSRRTTEGIDLLMRKGTLEEFRDRCVGRGYELAFPGAKRAFSDAETGVRIEVVVTGDYPGDGKPKDVVFPDPADVAKSGDDFRVVRLETLIDLKLASGMSAPHRLRDLADVQDLIVRTRLPLEFVERLHPSVRAEYRRLWETVRDVPREDDDR